MYYIFQFPVQKLSLIEALPSEREATYFILIFFLRVPGSLCIAITKVRGGGGGWEGGGEGLPTTYFTACTVQQLTN